MRDARPAQEPAASTASTSTVDRGSATKVAARKPPSGTPTPAASTVATTGKVFFTLGGVNYVCSGAATSSSNRDVVTTAGHCVNEGPGAFATNWAFVPAYNNGSRPYGTWTARSLVTTSAWANQGDINYDGGFAVMNTLNGAHLTDVVGGQGIGFNLARGLSYNAYGYPAAPPFNGETLKSCSGTASDDVWGGTQSQAITCDMTGGSSGGPWLTGSSTINSVNSFGYNGLNEQDVRAVLRQPDPVGVQHGGDPVVRRLLEWLLRRRGGVVISEVTTPPEQVEEYWTDERIRDAQPREQRLDPPER